MKKKEIKGLGQKSIKELREMIQKLTKESVELRLKTRVGKHRNFHEAKQKRHDISRIRTVISLKQIDGKKAGL